MTGPYSKSPQVSLQQSGNESSMVPDGTTDMRLQEDSNPFTDPADSPSSMRRPRPQTRTLSRISTTSEVPYKVYKRRFFGLAQLVLLNLVVSWDWLTFAPISSTAAQYFGTTESIINWLSTSFLFAFCAATPFTFWALNKHGPKLSITIAACLLLLGNWVKYGGTRANNFGVVMLGQIIIGLGQPFVLSAPTSYSNIWFSPAGRTTATAVASLANPLGGALGELISPFWATSPDKIPNTVLYVAIISSVACIPSFFVPARPPTPPAPSSEITHGDRNLSSILADLRKLFSSVEFYLLFIPFSILVGFFNAFSSLINQLLEPYGFSETDAGIAGALLIFVGLGSAAVSSPLIDKYKFYVLYIKIAVPILSVGYLIFVWVPQSRSLGFAYAISAILGAASFGLVPVALEFVAEIHYPLGPELSSTAFWTGGQILGGIFIIIMDALEAGPKANPPHNMYRSLVFEAVIALLAIPPPLMLGWFGRSQFIRRKRLESDRGSGEIIPDSEGSIDQER